MRLKSWKYSGDTQKVLSKSYSFYNIFLCRLGGILLAKFKKLVSAYQGRGRKTGVAFGLQTIPVAFQGSCPAPLPKPNARIYIKAP